MISIFRKIPIIFIIRIWTSSVYFSSSRKRWKTQFNQIYSVYRVENFRMRDIEINAWSSLIFNLETNLNSTNQSRVYEANKFEILGIIYDYTQKREGASKLKKTVFDFSLLFPKKNGLRRKSKVCPLDTVIK